MGLLGTAKKAGKKIYHGTSDLFDDFDVSKSADGSIWFTDNKSKILSGDVGASTNGNVMERIIDEDKLKLATWDDTDKYSTGQLIDQGFDGVKMVEDGENTYQIFNPEKLSKVESLNGPQGLLDMDTPSRMARAKEQGFGDQTYYHGTNADIDAFKINENGTNLVGRGIYAADAHTAGGYSGGVNPSVYPLKVKGNKATNEDAANARDAIGEGWDNDLVNEWLSERGFTHRDGRHGIVIFDPKNIRSTNAAFDPAKKSSSNILASNPVATTTAGLMANVTGQPSNMASYMQGNTDAYLTKEERQYLQNKQAFEGKFSNNDGWSRGDILPLSINEKTGETKFSTPEMVKGILSALYDIGQSKNTKINNPASLLDLI